MSLIHDIDQAFAARSPAREIILTRVIDAPRSLVFEAWTNAAHLPKWWGPKGFTVTTRSIEIKEGGMWRFVMHGPDGTDFENRIAYAQIVKDDFISFAHDAGKDGDPARFLVRVTFEEIGGKTKLTQHMVFTNDEQRKFVVGFGAIELGKTSQKKLDEYVTKTLLTKDTPVAPSALITRVFDAPRELLFDMFTVPEHLTKWFGPACFTLPGCDLDLQEGGKYRFTMRGPDGKDYPFHGVYQEITRPSRLVFTAVIEGMEGFTQMTIVDFDDVDGKTRVTVSQTAPSNPDYARGQVQGWSESFDKLADAIS